MLKNNFLTNQFVMNLFPSLLHVCLRYVFIALLSGGSHLHVCPDLSGLSEQLYL